MIGVFCLENHVPGFENSNDIYIFNGITNIDIEVG